MSRIELVTTKLKIRNNVVAEGQGHDTSYREEATNEFKLFESESIGQCEAGRSTAAWVTYYNMQLLIQFRFKCYMCKMKQRLICDGIIRKQGYKYLSSL